MDNNGLVHTKWNCKYHIVFTPKNCRQIIYKQISEDIGQIIRTLCDRKGIEIIEAASMPDHIYKYQYGKQLLFCIKKIFCYTNGSMKHIYIYFISS